MALSVLYLSFSCILQLLLSFFWLMELLDEGIRVRLVISYTISVDKRTVISGIYDICGGSDLGKGILKSIVF